MLKYEPYLEKKDEPDGGTEPKRAAPADTARPLTETASIAPDAGALLLDPGMADAGIGVEEKEKPWWQQEDIKDRLHEMKLEHLEADSDELLAKARLASTISDLIDERGLTQTQAAKLLETTQPKVSNLINGRLDGFSLERLARFLNTLGRDVEIVVKPRPRSRKTARILVSVGESS